MPTSHDATIREMMTSPIAKNDRGAGEKGAREERQATKTRWTWRESALCRLAQGDKMRIIRVRIGLSCEGAPGAEEVL